MRRCARLSTIFALVAPVCTFEYLPAASARCVLASTPSRRTSSARFFACLSVFIDYDRGGCLTCADDFLASRPHAAAATPRRLKFLRARSAAGRSYARPKYLSASRLFAAVRRTSWPPLFEATALERLLKRSAKTLGQNSRKFAGFRSEFLMRQLFGEQPAAASCISTSHRNVRNRSFLRVSRFYPTKIGYAENRSICFSSVFFLFWLSS